MFKSPFRIESAPMLLIVIATLAVPSLVHAQSEWPQWGGPSRDFVARSKGLASSWPDKGPKQLWTRALGEGHSSIVVDRNTLYTMYSQGDEEMVIALNANSGKTIWEHKYPAPTAGMRYDEGLGPHATPLIVGDLLYTVGSLGKVHALDKRTGKIVWTVDLLKDLGGKKRDRGYSCSPLAYKNTIILTLGGKDQAIVALDQKSGKVVWKNQSFDASPASMVLINVDGEDQLAAFMGGEIAGVNPNNGQFLWSHPHVTDWGLNISNPIWGNDNLLFISSAYNGGSRVLKLTRKGGKTEVSEVWFHRRLRLHHTTAMRIGDYVYASSGDFGPTFFSAVNVKTGEIAFQDRSFPKANFVYAESKLIILDEDGNLALATVSPAGLKVISKVSVMKNLAWTVPTLVGTKLYLRDRRTIAAFDLS